MRNLRHRATGTLVTHALAHLAALAVRAGSRYRQGYIHYYFSCRNAAYPRGTLRLILLNMLTVHRQQGLGYAITRVAP